MIKQVKKSKKGITPFFKVLILNIILLPSIVLADNIYMTCDQDNVTQNNLSCSIKGNTTKEIIAISLKVQTGNNLSFSKFIPSTVWQGDGEEGNIDLYTANDILGKYDIGTLNINVESSYQGLDTNITLYSISVYDKEGKEIKLDNYTKKIRITSSDNTLSNISISSGILSPTFSSNITTYSASVNTETIKISATPNNNNAKIEGDIGTKKLNYGNNTFKINVLSESKQTKTYILNITRIDNRNNQSNTTNNNNNTTNNNNNTTNNNINKEVKSSNTYLKSLTIKDNNITFQKNITNYDINVPYNTESIDIEALPEDNKSTVEITGNKDLKVGLNKIIILVTSEDKSTREYTINVNKKEEGYKLSNNNNISSIEITNYKLNYNKNKQNYILKIKNEKQLNIKVLLEDNKATYKILNNNNLKNNSIIKIIVSSEDNNTKTYTITVKTNHKTTIIIIFITIITILIGLNIYRIIRRSKEHEKYNN